MRIIIFSIAFIFLAFSAQSQVLKSAGVWYFLDVDSMTARPAVLPNGTELAYVVGTKTVYYWNRNTNTWTAYGSTFNRDSIYFDSSIIGSGTISDPWRVDSTLFATITAVGDSIAAALSYVSANYFPLQGGTLTGTGGAGYVGFPSQVSAPGTPASGLNVYAQGSSFNWKGTDGYERQFGSTLTGGRTYTLPDISGTFALGTGTTNRVPLWTATNTIGSSNLQDNGTAVSILNSKPFAPGQWTTAGRPTGVNLQVGANTTTNFLEGYFTSQWENIITSTGASANWVARFSSAGKIIGSSAFTADGSTVTMQGANSAVNTAVFNVHSGFTQGIRIRSIASDGRVGFYFFDSGGEQQAIASRATIGGTGPIMIGGASTLTQNAGLSGTLMTYQGRTSTAPIYIGKGFVGNENLIIAGAGTTGIGGVGITQMGTESNVFDIATERKASAFTFGGSRHSIRFTANTFLFDPNPGAGGVRSLGTTVGFGFGNNFFSTPTSFGGTSAPLAITNLENKSTTRASKILPNLTTAQRDALAGRVIGVTITSAGTGYGTATGITTIPITFTGGGGSGATATAYSYNTGAGVLFAAMTNEGSGYTSAPTPVFGGAGTGAAGTATITQLADGISIHNTDTKTAQYWESTTSSWRDYGSYQSGSLGIQTYTPARPLHVAGAARITGSAGTATAVMGRDANGDISNLGLSGLSIISGVLTATGSADGNGIYSGSGTLSQHTTRALIPGTGNLFFSQRFNSNADSAYFNIVNYLGGERAVNFGLTDTSSTGYSRGYFESDGAGSMNWGLQTSDVNGNTTLKALDGELGFTTTAGNISLNAPVDHEVITTGLVRAKQEAYYEINSTSSPQNLSNTYSDNFINQGGTQATFTLVFPASPEDGQVLKITYNNNISALTLDGNGNTIVGTTVTTAVEGTQRVFKFYASEGVWIRQN